ncbi:MAG: DMT family transporter [Bacteroidia bacterium]
MQKSTLSWVILIILSLVWGSSFILMKRGLEAFDSDEVAALRISIAFLFLLPFLIKYFKINLKKYFVGLIFMGVFGNLIPAFLFTKAETQISSSLTGMLNALTPLFTIIIGFVWFKEKPGNAKIFGIIIGFIAACGLVVFDKSTQTSNNVLYAFYVLLATVFYALSINGIKKYLSDLDSIKATVWAFCFTGPIALVYLFTNTKFTTHIQLPNAMVSISYISILAIVGSALTVIIYNYLIKTAGAVFASSCTYLIPIVAIGWGLFDGEKVSVLQIICILILILSVYIINKPQKFAQ